MKREFQQYYWIEVLVYARDIFIEDDYMYSWIQDAWNIFIFNRPVTESNITKTHLDAYEKADVLLWLTALYDLYYAYQVTIDDEVIYGEYEKFSGNSCFIRF